MYKSFLMCSFYPMHGRLHNVAMPNISFLYLLIKTTICIQINIFFNEFYSHARIHDIFSFFEIGINVHIYFIISTEIEISFFI